MYSIDFYKLIERSDSTILGNLGILDHFRHFFVKLCQHVRVRNASKSKSDNVELDIMSFL